ncbi:unnamed protein product [Linum trigynum]|uniref:Uncharacterized protein n=1 Tax=Linum trigynum TaxID=586398 RepID=A0AAV2C6U4_9ROSI
MRSPIVAKINGSVGDYRGHERPAIPSASNHCFAILDLKDVDGSSRSIDQWHHRRPLPTPPFYQKGTLDYSSCLGRYKFKLGVIGHKLYVFASSAHNYICL